MKTKKIIISLLIICLLAIVLAIVIPFYNSYKFENYGKKELLDYLTNITDENKKQEEINSALEKGWIEESDLKANKTTY